jgi:protein-disulfide isomerase
LHRSEDLPTITGHGVKTMKTISAVGGAVLAGLMLLTPPASRAQDLRGEIDSIIKDYIAAHPDEVGEIVKDYFIKHPEAVGQILAELLKHRPGANATANAGAATAPSAKPAEDHSAAVASNAAELFSSAHQVTLGNPQGDVTLVEFFDYNCGFCKRALPDTLALLKDDPKLRVVLKEFPILGPGSADAARVAVAVRMQDPDGQKYLAFHQELLGSPGPASKDKALTAAKDQGLDMARLEQDMASKEVDTTLAEDMKLARALGVSGTPSYVVGKDLVVGAVGVAALKDRIVAARSPTAAN